MYRTIGRHLLSITFLLAIPGVVFAYIQPLNTDTATYMKQPNMTDSELQLLVLDIQNAPCSDLEALDHDVKRIFLMMNMLMQRPGALSSIVGPKCTFLGEAEKVATIDDGALTVSGKSEILYFLPEFSALIVSNREKNAIGYGIFIEEDTEPYEEFMSRRDEMASFAANAQGFLETVGSMEPPVYTPPPLNARNQQVGQNPPTPRRVESVTQPQVVGQHPTNTAVNTAPDPSGNTVPSKQVPSEAPRTGNTAPGKTVPDTPTTDPSQVAAEPNTPPLAKPVYKDTPNIKPLGPPAAEPSVERSSSGMLALLIFGIIVVIIVAVVVLKTRVRKEQGYMDQ